MTPIKAASSNLSSAMFGLLAFAIFSFHDVIIKYLGGIYSPIQIVFFGSLLTFPLLTLVLIGDNVPGTLRPVHPWWILLRSLSGVASALGAFYAFSVLPLAQVYAILFAAPLLITILAVPMLGETVRLRRGLAVVIGLAGVMAVLRPSSTEFGLGHAAALVSAVTGAINAIIVRKIGAEERPVVMILYPMMANLILMAIALPFVYKPMPIMDFGAMSVVAALVLMAMSCLITAYRSGVAVIVAPMQYSQILWAAVYGALFFNEFPDMMTWVGAGIITLSGLYILKRESTGTTSQNTPVLATKTRVGLPVGLRVDSLSKLSDPEK
ncbi:MAG: drug/metabolite transporter (DMT)-like permease [Paracoccaceae bacterium]|jgi:drug/metabolite transporter (DMT)-like permease